MKKNRDRTLTLILIVSMALGCIVRIVSALNFPDRIFWTDEADYLALSDQLFSGKGYINDNGTATAYRAPGYPLFLVGLKFIGINTLLGIRFVQVFLSTLIIFLVYRFASMIFDRQVGVVSAFIVAFYPYFIFLPGVILATTLFTLLLISGTYILYKSAVFPNIKSIALAGVLFGLMTLTRPSGQALFAAAVLWLFFINRSKKGVALQTTAAFVLAFCLVVAPWYVRNYTKLHVCALVTNGGRNLWLGNNPYSTADSGSNVERPEYLERLIRSTKSEVERDRIYLREAKKYIAGNPGRFAVLSLKKAFGFWRWDPSPTTGGYLILDRYVRWLSILTFGPVFLLGILGIVLSSKPSRRFILLWFGYALFFTILHAIIITKVRFRLPLDHFMIILASFSLVHLFEKSLAPEGFFKALWSEVKQSWRREERIALPVEKAGSPPVLYLASLMRKIDLSVPYDSRKILLCILGFALLLRIVFVLTLKADGFYLSDTRYYDYAARSIVAGEGFGDAYYRSPFYPVVMAAVYFVFGESFVAMRLFEAVLGVLLCYLIFLICRRLFDKRVALLAAGFAAIYPHFIILAGILYSTNVFTVLLASTLFFMLKARVEKPLPFVALSGVFAGLAALTVPAVFFMLPIWGLWILFQHSRTLLFKATLVLVFLTTFVLVLSPWTIRNYSRFGRLVLVRPLPSKVLPDFEDEIAQERKIVNGFRDVADYYRENPTGTQEDAISKTFLHYLKNPWGSIKFMFKEMVHFWALYPDRLNTESPQFRAKIHAQDSRMVLGGDRFWRLVKTVSIIVMLPVFLLALVGLVYSRPIGYDRMLLLLSILSLSIGYSLIYAEVRYRIPIEPYVLMFTACGFSVICSRLGKKCPKTVGSDGV